MDRNETIKVLSILKAAYPNSYSRMTTQEANATISIWASQFRDAPADVVIIAVQKLIARLKFPPSVAEVREEFRTIHAEAYEMLVERTTMTDEERSKVRSLYDATDRLTRDYGSGITLGALMMSGRKELTGE